MPVFFDRVDAAARSLYGFQNGSFDVPGIDRLGSTHNVLKAKVREFLRLEERSGPPVAIAVVLDCAMNGSKCMNLDQGFSFARVEEDMKMKSLTENEGALLRCPAIYIRSTVQPSATGRLLGMGRSNGTRERDGTNFSDHDGTLSSWPYTSWASLIAVLTEAVSHDSEIPAYQFQWSPADNCTFFRATAINPSMWLVFMVKMTEDNRWHRRKSSKIVDDDIQGFFDEVVALLRMDEWFRPSNALEIRRQMVERSACSDLASHLISERNWDDENTNALLQLFRESFGVRAPRTKESLKASYGIRFGKVRATKSPKPVRPRESVTNGIYSHAMSANAFFLGSQLMNAIGAD